MKKIVCILGSPRMDGNGAAIANRFLKTAESIGVETTTFELNNLNYKGCQACMACKTTSERCVVDDDMKGVLAAIKDADVLVIASPNYFGQVTGQFKSFFDRMYSYLKPTYMTEPNPGRLASGKQAVTILTQGGPDADAFDIMGVYGRYLKMFGFEAVHTIHGLGYKTKTDAAESPEIMRQAEELARKVMG